MLQEGPSSSFRLADPEETRPAPRPTDSIDVWWIRLDLSGPVLSTLRSLLDREERERAERFHFPADRDRFVAAHGQLRILLGFYLSVFPEDLSFGKGPKGKPRLEGQGAAIFFNLSHSGEGALVALAADLEVGVDLERLAGRDSGSETARRFFSARERELLSALPESGRRRAFYQIWTRKEAFLKACGLGLSFGLREFSVSLDSRGCEVRFEPGADAPGSQPWWVRPLEPAPGYTGALAYPLTGVGGSRAEVRVLRSFRLLPAHRVDRFRGAPGFA